MLEAEEASVQNEDLLLRLMPPGIMLYEKETGIVAQRIELRRNIELCMSFVFVLTLFAPLVQQATSTALVIVVASNGNT